MAIDKSKKLYSNDTDTDGVTENVEGEQTIQTSKTKILKGSADKEILIGKDLEEIDKNKDGYDTLQRRIIEKLMK